MATNGRECSIANALAVIGERWSLLALREVLLGVRRFDEIARNTGASRDILAARLRTLVDRGVLAKELYQEHPPRYEYVPTAAARDLQPVILGLMQWGDRYATEGPPPSVFAHDCGAELRLQIVCAHCDRPVEPGSTHAVRLGAVR
ncbi:helix-turn-helix transcriptional regulator [Frankia sp. CNm7]|uniref:Helix-turn-helix transcriptional regulator n=1 Tax=Frankia nepalensis TaxID=1836974 RepID=A0A937US00_9ACTN|nr:helix-turn-helix domain-containing protein [Frankia nepalensis]MBL7498430.1 helix-turn-helix transcriptional regulator [Frankia nepalensis]MBL7509956.1 helix-turn-helix transcriptional regulator [Frankia nepalensis]MBL7520174.1 helix-turn-helix transcriptional regulator [Frankia nepalensis]MBL7629760.1 helix-turn-helix transcriptional regulator [Frankia nepalensis]